MNAQLRMLLLYIRILHILSRELCRYVYVCVCVRLYTFISMYPNHNVCFPMHQTEASANGCEALPLKSNSNSMAALCTAILGSQLRAVVPSSTVSLGGDLARQRRTSNVRYTKHITQIIKVTVKIKWSFILDNHQSFEKS